MKSFATIFREAQKLSPGKEQHSWIVQQCAQELSKLSVPVHEYPPLIPKRDADSRILIGAAFYSLYDLELIDEITTKLHRKDTSAEQLEIFDVTSCKSQADFEACLPGISKVFQPPVVGIWRNGKLVETASGHNAAKILRSHYGCV